MEERTLTPADIEAVAQAVARQNSCSIGISREDAAELCEWFEAEVNANTREE